MHDYASPSEQPNHSSAGRIEDLQSPRPSTRLFQILQNALAEYSNPRSLIEALKTHPRLEVLFQAANGQLEESLQNHCECALALYEEYFRDTALTDYFSKSAMRLLFALHDIGKPLGATNGPEQYEYHVQVLDSISDELPLSALEKAVIREFVSDDIIGGYGQGYYTLEEAASIFREASSRLGVSPVELFKIYTIYFQCDAGAYTVVARNSGEHDFLFKITEDQKFVMADDEPRVLMSDFMEQKIRNLNAILAQP